MSPLPSPQDPVLLCPRPQSFDFVAHQSGTFAFCFNNQMSRWTAKVVDMEVIVQRTSASVRVAMIM